MFWLIENKDQVNSFRRKGYKKAYIEVIPFSNTIHPVLNNISLVYIKPLNGDKGYMVTIDHSEAFTVENNLVTELLDEIETIYVRDKKNFLHYYFHKTCHQTKPTSPTDIPKETQVYQHFYKLYPNKEDINRIIPITKHYEYCEILYENQIFPSEVNPFYNDKMPLVFNMIERNGLKIDNDIFNEYFDNPSKNFIYTRYNLNTLTTRPSNSFKGINFAALNKENGERKCFIPRNDIFIDLDISAYHPNLLARVIDYKFDDEDIHEAFAKMYGVDYKKAKELTFKQMYGGVFKQYEHLEFFSKVKKFTTELWETFNNEGEIICPISNYRFRKDDLEDMNPQKLLNYFLQNLETSNNVIILWKILKVLRGMNTKLVLYVYDSFLFDYDKNEKEVMYKIKDIFDSHNLNIKAKKGKNYNFK
tara:strand:- start:13506 stop:14759 length:1254 start_codon:yes stop_codon:yes gene_type:complete